MTLKVRLDIELWARSVNLNIAAVLLLFMVFSNMYRLQSLKFIFSFNMVIVGLM